VRLAGVAWRDLRLTPDRHTVHKAGRKIMPLTRRQALCTSTFALGGAVLAPQLAKAETAAPKTAITADPAQKLVTEQFMIDAADPGIKLYIRNKRTEDLKQFTSEKTLLFVHGASQPSEATFDLPLEGLSWMDYIAQHGWDVYLIDVRGYGRSTRPPEMDQPPASNPPIVTTDVAVKDVGSAIDFILQRRGVSKLSLMGWSWGTVIMGAYAADHNDKVDRLVLYAPTWLSTSPPPQTAPPPLGAYVAAPMATARQRLQAGAPDDRKNDLMPANWFEAWSAAALASDPVGSKQEPPVLRSPAGVFQDNRTYWDAGKPYYDPGRIKNPTLVVVAEWDQVTPSQGAQALFHKLPSGPNKRLVEIGEGTHFVMLEKNRMQLFQEVQLFLDWARRN
jgi:pimeloyl-ACP methyl ester carboxylesterase